MKKCLSAFLAAVLVLSLAACGSAPAPAPAPASSADASGAPESSASTARAGKINLIIGTGGVGGTYYPLGGALAKVWTSNMEGVSVAAQSTGASVENTALIENNEIELGLTQNDLAEYAVKGEYMFDKEYKKLKVIGRLYSEDIQVFVREDAGINSISDMKGKRISLSYPGSGANANAEQILGVFGITPDDVKAEYPSNSDTADRIKDGLLDGMLTTTGAPNATFQEMCMSAKVKLLSFTDEELDQIIAKYPFFAKKTLPAGMYEGQTEDVHTVCVQSILVASADLDEDLVYDLTKTLWENQGELSGMLAALNDLSIDKALDGITVDYHPGAIKYYKEIGKM